MQQCVHTPSHPAIQRRQQTQTQTNSQEENSVSDWIKDSFVLFTEPWAATKTAVISHDTYCGDICQLFGTFYAKLYK